MSLVRSYRFRVLVLGLAAVVGPLWSQASADTLLTSHYNATGTVYHRTSSSDSPLGQQFTLTQAVTISGVSGYIGDVTGTVTSSGMSMQILSDNAGTMGSVVTGGTSSAPTGSISNIGFLPLDFAFSGAPTLQPGNYWLELTSNQGTGNITRWLQQSSEPGTSGSPPGVGTFNNDVYYLGSYYAGGAGSNMFDATINGSVVSSVPEPSPLLLGGVLALLGAGFGRCRLSRGR